MFIKSDLKIGKIKVFVIPLKKVSCQSLVFKNVHFKADLKKKKKKEFCEGVNFGSEIIKRCKNAKMVGETHILAVDFFHLSNLFI